jgi:PTH1 family peptidyl-tRNA hydrolase
MKVVVGLGNPGSRYHATRHNVGYAIVDALAAGPDVDRFQNRFEAEIAEWRIEGEKVLLVKPQTFMNLSGRCVRQVLDYYQVETEDLFVLADDINLPLGKLRIRRKGTHGGHNGLRDIQNHLGTTEYARLRLGVGGPADDAIDHVLGKFRPAEKPVIEDAVIRSAQAVVVWVRRGIEVCMNEFNAEAPKSEE